MNIKYWAIRTSDGWIFKKRNRQGWFWEWEIDAALALWRKRKDAMRMIRKIKHEKPHLPWIEIQPVVMWMRGRA